MGVFSNLLLCSLPPAFLPPNKFLDPLHPPTCGVDGGGGGCGGAAVGVCGGASSLVEPFRPSFQIRPYHGCYRESDPMTLVLVPSPHFGCRRFGFYGCGGIGKCLVSDRGGSPCPKNSVEFRFKAPPFIPIRHFRLLHGDYPGKWCCIIDWGCMRCVWWRGGVVGGGEGGGGVHLGVAVALVEKAMQPSPPPL